MTQWKLTLAYNGSGFHGWQVQPGLTTVQGTLAEALARLTGESLLPQGAGRTDTGVHALGQVASFGLRAPIPAANLKRSLNRTLPSSLRVLEAETVPPDFHARHSGRGKLYEYRIFERRRRRPGATGMADERICSPFLAPFVWDCRWPLDLAAMQHASQSLLGTQDFTAMAATDRRPDTPDGETATSPNPVKTILEAGWLTRDDLLCFRIRGSGFLHHMVRNIVGTLIDVGRGSLPPTALPGILASKNRAAAGPTAPASGLYLVEVHYPPQTAPLPVTEAVAAGGTH